MNTKFKVKQPTFVEAFQLTEDRWSDWADWPQWLVDAIYKTNDEIGAMYSMPNGERRVNTSQSGVLGEFTYYEVVNEGDWIIQNRHGELYPCRPESFADCYEPTG